ncbi:MAG: Dam family site-specific DNA-(adenine-N6)-methyltransferase [Chloroflexi bacterium]|nr:Dam family site-specific DNA-(adenine-N6)-methyltransferase [Chloroflexota bacterium]
MTAGLLKPPLKWAGGKRWLVPHVRPLWEPFRQRRYVEPFCGGLALPLNFIPAHAVLNDMNAHLINFYRQVQDGLRMEIPTVNDSVLYYQHRDTFNALIREGRAQSKTAAELFYYLNRTGYNGLCRFNKKGGFNVPFGKYTTIHYAPDFYAYQSALAPWMFSAGDFAQIDLDSGDFIYADPPYDVPFVQYSQTGFTWEDQVRLAEWLARHRGPVVLSNQATERICALYERLGFTLMKLPAPRRISCNGDRTPAIEVLAIPGHHVVNGCVSTLDSRCRDEECLVLIFPLTPHPSPTQAGRGALLRALLAPLPEFGEGPGVGSKRLDTPPLNRIRRPRSRVLR